MLFLATAEPSGAGSLIPSDTAEACDSIVALGRKTGGEKLWSRRRNLQMEQGQVSACEVTLSGAKKALPSIEAISRELFTFGWRLESGKMIPGENDALRWTKGRFECRLAGHNPLIDEEEAITNHEPLPPGPETFGVYCEPIAK